MAKMSKQHGLPTPSKKEVIETIKIFDENNDGKISFEEFMHVTKSSYEKTLSSKESLNANNANASAENQLKSAKS